MMTRQDPPRLHKSSFPHVFLLIVVKVDTMFVCCVSCRKTITGKHCGNCVHFPNSLPIPLFVDKKIMLAIVGKHFGREGQCPKSLPKPIFVRETTCREPGTTPRKPKMKLKLWDVK